MRLRFVLAGAAVLLLLVAWAPRPAAAQAPLVGCPRALISTTTVTRGFGPSIAAHPVLRSTGIIANGVAAFFPEQVEVTTVTNFQGIEGLTRITVHSTITGDRTLYVVPDWLVRAYGGDTGRIVADVESGRLRDAGPCP